MLISLLGWYVIPRYCRLDRGPSLQSQSPECRASPWLQTIVVCYLLHNEVQSPRSYLPHCGIQLFNSTMALRVDQLRTHQVACRKLPSFYYLSKASAATFRTLLPKSSQVISEFLCQRARVSSEHRETPHTAWELLIARPG